GDYLLGIGGLVERLAAGPLVRNVLGRLARAAERHTVPWDELDLTDPERPRLRHTLAELRRRDGARGHRPRKNPTASRVEGRRPPRRQCACSSRIGRRRSWPPPRPRPVPRRRRRRTC